MKRFDGNITVLNLEETYLESGAYSFKVILNPNVFKTCHKSKLTMYDPKHNEMCCDVKMWGRKINCNFNIGDDIGSGVCMIEMDLMKEDGTNIREIVKFWVIR